MSRHSKWAKVKQFKGAIDAKRSASFTKLAREITVATREKGPDPEMNARLRTAIMRARDASMPKDAIERAVARASGAGGEGQIESLTYEAYAPGGAALVIECLTDNRNRAANEVKHTLSEHGGSLASTGSVTYLFDHLGVIRTPLLTKERGRGEVAVGKGEVAAKVVSRDDLELALIDAGATDIRDADEKTEISCAPADLSKVADAAAKLGLQIESAEFEWLPKNLVETDEQSGTKAAELIEELEANDDVQRVFSNLA